ncbi:solute carrier family 22 member 5-like [Takifugu rubripes]|uniref:solute carrier family 22 member 5-like n=1 Tax=Takifugu rubripes TaxID=31033 RepID=UPI001145AD88|nr:solute carrier family 22 member 5-like [Takifugu rubripes]
MEADDLTDFDQAISFLDNYGLFQIIIILLLSLTAAPVGFSSMTAVFVSDTPEFRCKVSLDSAENSSWVGDWVWNSRCSRDRDHANWTGDAGLSNGTEPCVDGWDFSSQTHTSTIVTEWGLVCENAWKVPFSTSLFFAGYLCGSFINGHLSDRFGRRPVLFTCLVIHGATALVQAISVSWIMFCILNWLKGVSQTYSVSIILGSELLPKSSRVTFSTIAISLGYCFGYMLLPLSAYFIRGWRMLLVISAILSFLQVPTCWVIPESPRWLLNKGRVDEAELVIRNAAKRNKVPAPEVIFRPAERCQTERKSDDKRTYNFIDLVSTTNIRNTTIFCCSIWMCITFVFYGLSLNTSNLNGNIYLNCFISAAIDSFAYVAIWVLVDRLPRPTLLSGTMMFSGATLLIMKLIPEDNTIVLQVLGLVGKIGVGGAFSIIFLFVTELMPTVVRNMGMGVGATSGFLGTMICPYILYTGVYMKILPFLIFGAACIVASLLSMLLPDTRYGKLPDLISEVKPIRCCGCTKRRTWESVVQE